MRPDRLKKVRFTCKCGKISIYTHSERLVTACCGVEKVVRDDPEKGETV